MRPGSSNPCTNWLLAALIGLLGADRSTFAAAQGAAPIGYWSRFAKTGDPNGVGAPEWPKYREETDADMSLGQEVKVEHGLRRAQRDLWDRIER